MIFHSKNAEFEFFEDLIHNMLKMQPEMTEAMKIRYFCAHSRKEALQTFINISQPNRKTPDDVPIVFRRKNLKPESQATAKHKWLKPTSDLNVKSLSDFLKKLNECAEREFGENAQHMIDSLIYAKLPPHIKRSLNVVYLENGTDDQFVSHLENELELSGMENDGQSSLPAMTAVPPTDNQQNTKQTTIACHYCIKQANLLEMAKR